MSEKVIGGWSKSQIKDFVKEVRKETGEGWSWIVPRVKCALIAEKAFQVARALHRGSVAIEDMDALLNAMLIEACLRSE